MAQYRKKPVVIDAAQFDGTPGGACAMFEQFDIPGGKYVPSADLSQGHITIPTLEGVMSANAGDYIIKGVKGEFYPCKPDIFAASYENVRNDPPKPMPLVLRVVGLDIPLLLRGDDDNYLDDKMGYCDFKRNHIILSDMNPLTVLRETCLHEVLHAVDHAVQSSLCEEDVHRLARALYAVLRDNPAFVDWLVS